MTRPLLLVAASGLAREAAAAARAGSEYEVIGFVDDDSSRWGLPIEGVPVLGGLDVVARWPEAAVLLCAGKGSARLAIAARLAEQGCDPTRYATLVHPAAQVADSCTLGSGTIVLAGSVLTTAVTVGRHVVVMPNVTLTHDNVLSDYVTVTAGVSLGGWVHVGERSYLGMNASVRERVQIAADATVGMGSVVLHDVGQGVTVVGNPAHELTTTTPSILR